MPNTTKFTSTEMIEYPQIGDAYYDGYVGDGVIIMADQENDKYTILWQNGQIGWGDHNWLDSLVNMNAVNHRIKSAIMIFQQHGNNMYIDDEVDGNEAL